MPMEESLLRRMRDDATLRSRRMRMERETESAAVRRSLVILRWSVSVLWWGRKLDWKNSEFILEYEV